MSSLTIVPASVSDIPAIIRLQEAIWYPTYGNIISREQMDYMFDLLYSPSSLRDQMESKKHIFGLLTRFGEPGGFVSYSGPGAEGHYHLHKLYVLPGLQGTGAGKALISFVEAQVVKSGGKALRLNVNRYNSAKAFYERMGYRVLYEEDLPIGPYWMNDYVMGKSL